MAQQNPPQFAATYHSWPQPMHHPYHPGFPPNPLAQPYPPTSPYAGREQLHYTPVGQPELLQPHSSVQMLSQELVAAQRRLLQYSDLISSLYAELERIQNIVCHNCRERISPANLAQHHPLVFAPQIPIVASEGSFNRRTRISHLPTAGVSATIQANPFNTQLTNPRPASPILGTLAPSPVIPVVSNVLTETSLSTSHAKSGEETTIIAQPVIEKPQWSVIYNPEIEKVLDITFVHAFKHTSPVYSVRFSPDGKFLAAGLDHGLGSTHIYAVNEKSKKCTLSEYSDYTRDEEFPPRGIWCVCFSPDGRYLVVGCSFQMIYIWEIANKRLLASFMGHTDAIRSLDVSPDGRLLVTGSNDGSVRIWKMRDGSSKVLSTGRSLFTSVRFSPNGRYVAASNFDRFLRIWNVRSGQLVGKWTDPEGVIRCMAFTPDGEVLASGCWDGMIRSWDVSSLNAPAQSILSAGERIREPGTLAKEYERPEPDKYTGGIRSVAISPDGKWVTTGPSDKHVLIWDMHSAVQQCTLEGHTEVLSSVDFSPVGRYIATGGADGFVTLWRYETVQSDRP